MSEVEVAPQAVPQIRQELSVEEITERLKKFDKLKQSVLKQHILNIHGNNYIKKSGWRIASVVFCVSDEITGERRIENEDGSYTIEYTVTARTPDGRTSVGVGSCNSLEKQGNRKDHDVRTMAHTRAKNRAISDIIGTGEVSAEEMEGNGQENVGNPVLDGLIENLKRLGYDGPAPENAYEAAMMVRKLKDAAQESKA